ncbi:MAG: lamin tail domain-containing protein, partial [Patescibacteria group bacterium]
MERLILFSLVLSFLFISFPRESFAYNIGTHAYLTDEIVNFYNKNFLGNQIPEGFRNYMIDGSRKEDDNIRPMNHFYDPVNNVGFHDSLLGSWEKSKDWANNQTNQNSVKYKVPATIASILSAAQTGKISGISSETNFTWHKALEYYVNGKKEKAFFALGHILHLIEDASVPDHTRNDPHPGDSPYENWTDKFKLNNKDSGLPGRLNGKSPIQLSDLNSYFDGLAKYSNNNFYSKDTISGYFLPQADYFRIESDGKSYGIKIDNEFGDYPVVRANGVFSFNNDELLNRPTIMSQYWSRLSTKSVQYGAGIVYLFFKEAEMAKNDPNFKKQNQKSFLASIGEAIRGIFQSADNAGNSDITDTISGAIFDNSTQSDEVNSGDIGEKNILSPEKGDVEMDERTVETDEEIIETDEEFTETDEEIIETSEGNSEMDALNERIDSLISRTANLKSKALAKKAIPEVVSLKTPPATSMPKLPPIQAPPVQAPVVQQPALPPIVYYPPVTYYYYYNQTANATSTATSTNSSNGGNNSTSTNTNATSSALNSVGTSTFSNTIFVSELLFHATGDGGDVGKEFVELYNDGNQSLNLSGWSLKYFRSDSTSTNSLALFGESEHTADRTTIPAKGYLLVGLNNYNAINYSGTAADVSRTASLPNVSGASEGVAITAYLFDSGGAGVGGLAYTNASISQAGQSLERKAKPAGSCISAGSGEGEFAGNSCSGSQSGDFETRSNPKPQNSGSLPEPRMAPNLTGASLTYSSSTMKLVFKWNEALDSMGDALSVRYEIRNASTSEIFATTSAAIGLSRSIDEIGRNYAFSLRAFDRDGLGSTPANLSADVPSFFSNLYFYRDSRSGGGNVVDAYYGNYPFIPGSYGNWKLVLLYVNAAAPKDANLIENNKFSPADNSNLAILSYLRCSGDGYATSDKFLLFPEGDHCSSLGGGLNPQGMSGLEDFHFIVPIAVPSGVTDFGPSAYVTAAFYDYSSTIGGYANFRLAAADKRQYHFQSAPPPSLPPLAPADVTLQFDSLHSALNLAWPKATDPDSLDNNIFYEFNYSSSTEFSPAGWQSTGRNLSVNIPVNFPYGYKIGVRAIDDFGNISQPVAKNWNFPVDYSPFPHQNDASQIVGTSNGAGQRIFIQIGSNAGKIGMTVGKGAGPYSVTDT